METNKKSNDRTDSGSSLRTKTFKLIKSIKA